MKKALAAGIVLAGLMAVSGTAFATDKTAQFQPKYDKVAKVQSQKPPVPPEGFSGKRPMMSSDKRPPLPPDGRHPRVSRDKRPPMPPRSGDRRPPEFDRNQPQQGAESKW